MRYASILLTLVSGIAYADSTTISADGINSKATGLDGSTTDEDAPGIEIGQVEPSRSAKPNYGTPPEPAASNTRPVAVYLRTALANPDEADGIHATKVAGVMIGDDSVSQGIYEGVAPKANLHSGALGSGSDNEFVASADVNFALTANRIARLSGPGIRVRAINVSAIRALQEPVEKLDGTTHPTQFIDWSARAHDVLYAISWGNDSSPQKRIPTDNFNGMTVAASEICSDPQDPACAPNTHAYRKFGSVNNTQGLPEPLPRTSISLIAPGQDILVLEPGDMPAVFNGTSAAAPHVTGTVALLQQYTSKQMSLSDPRFEANSQRHEVMKAVMMNAADKLDGVHGSTRDVLSLNGQTWLSSPAHTDDTVPLDTWIGAGHLNAKRSVQQFRPGEYNPGAVPSIGWDYQSVGGSSFNQYIFDQQIGGGYIAVTLAWDRRVVKEGSPNQNNYLDGDGFVLNELEDSLNNLDLYLMPAASNDFTEAIAKSVSPVMSVEHVFFNIPAAGEYKLVVHNNALGGIGDNQSYALAWWFGSAPPLPIAGDHNGDGAVNAADYVVWRKGPDQYGGDPGGYDAWRSNFGNGSGSGSLVASIPEPSSSVLLLSAIAVMVRRLRSSSYRVAV